MILRILKRKKCKGVPDEFDVSSFCQEDRVPRTAPITTPHTINPPAIIARIMSSFFVAGEMP